MTLDCPRCVGSRLQTRPGPLGIVVDACSRCSGVWLDRSEVYAYTTDPSRLHAALAVAYKTPTGVSRYLCRRCEKQMYEVAMKEGPRMDVCPACGGSWFDAAELEALDALLARNGP